MCLATIHGEQLSAFGNKKREISPMSPPLLYGFLWFPQHTTIWFLLPWFFKVLTYLCIHNYIEIPKSLHVVSSRVYFGCMRQWDVYLLTQIRTDLPRRDEVISSSKTAKRLLRQRGASHDNKLNWKTEDWSQRSYLDKLDFEKKAIHLICPGVFSLRISKNREAIPDLD